MPRPRTSIGTFGELNVTKTPNGQFCAPTRFRDHDGRLRRVRATASSPKAAERRLKELLADRADHAGRVSIIGWTFLCGRILSRRIGAAAVRAVYGLSDGIPARSADETGDVVPAAAFGCQGRCCGEFIRSSPVVAHRRIGDRVGWGSGSNQWSTGAAAVSAVLGPWLVSGPDDRQARCLKG